MLGALADPRVPLLVLYLLASWVLWYAIIVIHRLFFHPLAKVPGHKLAAATLLYQTWHCFVGGSRFYIQIEKLHEKYGPAIRIGPNEVHLSDPENYDKINRVGTKFSKDGAFYGAFGNPNSSFTTPSNELHRLRRGGLNSFFSRKVVLQLEDIVHEKTELLASLVRKALDTGDEVDMHHGLRAVSIDVVTDYAFGACYDLLKEPDLGLKFFTLVHKIGPAAWIFRQCPWLKSLAMAIPEPIIKVISEPIGQVRDMQNHCHKQLLTVKENRDAGLVKEDARPTIFSALMDPQEGFSKGAVDNLEDEAYTVITAAADTTGNAMTTMTRCVVENPDIYHKLHAELCEAFPDSTAELNYAALEKLPYLVSPPVLLLMHCG
jgi:cytochrome P450